MYELKNIGKVFTSKFVGTGPSSYEKRIYRAAVLQRLRNTHSVPKVNNTGYFWKAVITMGMTEKQFRQCINRGSTKTVNDTY